MKYLLEFNVWVSWRHEIARKVASWGFVDTAVCTVIPRNPSRLQMVPALLVSIGGNTAPWCSTGWLVQMEQSCSWNTTWLSQSRCSWEESPAIWCNLPLGFFFFVKIKRFSSPFFYTLKVDFLKICTHNYSRPDFVPFNKSSEYFVLKLNAPRSLET